jgi:hypothetical protein
MGATGTSKINELEQGAEENMWAKREEGPRGCRTLHDEELHNLYALPSVIGVIKSRRMR